jgi:hypothetical protein
LFIFDNSQCYNKRSVYRKKKRRREKRRREKRREEKRREEKRREEKRREERRREKRRREEEIRESVVVFVLTWKISKGQVKHDHGKEVKSLGKEKAINTPMS